MTGRHRILSDFEGDWQLSRRVTHGDGRQARLSGLARWVPSSRGLDYVEQGELVIPGQPPMAAEQRYVWGEDLSVFFMDGRLFHRVPSAGGPVSHWCDPDTYEGLYDFSNWPVFEVSWLVSGPCKAYHMHSIYRRAPV